MDPIDEQRYFETINGREIRCCCSTTDNSVEILIENLAFVAERQRNIQQIVGILLVCILLNAAIGHQHAILIAVNVAFFVVIAIKCHVLANFVEFGKHIMTFITGHLQMHHIKCTISICLFECREIACC